MRSAFADTPVSKRQLRIGVIIGGLLVAFLVFDIVVRLLMLKPAMEGTARLGYSQSLVLPIGVIELACLSVYLIPRTRVLGAILLTGYLGGAVASQVRAGNPLFTHELFPIYVAAMAWGSLLLRDERLRALLPLRQDAPRP